MQTQHTVRAHGLRRPMAAYLLVVSVVLLAAGGLSGGVAFVADRSGGLLGMDRSYLAGSPVSDYLLPGIFLLVVFGLIPAFTAFGLIRRSHWRLFDRLEHRFGVHWSWQASVTLAVVLILWIGFQGLFLGLEAPAQVATGILGLVILGLALLPRVRHFYAGN